MQDPIRAIVTEGRIQPLDDLSLPDGTEVLVTVVADDNRAWLNASTPSLAAIWDNSEDDVYAELLEG